MTKNVTQRKSSLLFFHGILGTSADWEAVVDHLPEFGCFGVDLPGHGTTPFTEDFFGELPCFGEPVHLIGYSMGGRLAMQYAACFPEKVASLTVISAHFGLRDPQEKEERLAVDRAWAQQFLEDPIDEVLKRWYDQPLFRTLRVDFSMRRKQNVKALAQTLIHYSVAKQPFLQPKEALYLVGEHDAKYRALYQSVPHRVIPHASHAVHLENPQAVAQAIRSHICIQT